MSKENVALFSRSLGRNPDLNQKISEAAPTVEAWVAVARDAGFEFTREEFVSAVGETLGRVVTPATAVQEYLGAQYKVGELELSRKTLDAIVGGRRMVSNLL
jgi:predicted ribosomally synthesized peptide with nif11-like leader